RAAGFRAASAIAVSLDRSVQCAGRDMARRATSIIEHDMQMLSIRHGLLGQLQSGDRCGAVAYSKS
ncbi:MAG: hypothetical protein AAFU70_12350, partial [Planctomycetota bacterium]